MFDVSQFGYIHIVSTGIVALTAVEAAVTVTTITDNSVVVFGVVFTVRYLESSSDQYPAIQTLVGSVDYYWSIPDILVDVCVVRV